MKDNYYSFLNIFFCTIVLGFCSILKSKAQSISKPTFLFTQACASESFNTYPVNFVFAPFSDFTAGNTFFLQLSDASGNFSATPTEVANSTTIAVAPGVLNFLVPTNFVGGEGYKFRIRSSAPALLSPPSNIVPIYFQTFTKSFSINDQLPTAKFCTGSTAILSVDNPTAPPTSLVNLSYRWFRNSILIPGANLPSLSINTTGVYYADINYGSCSTASSITRSQDVTVTAAAAVPAILINSNTGLQIPTGNFSTLTAVQNSSFAYQWFKNGVLIPGAINFNLVTNQAATYYVSVNNGICSVQSNSITLILQTSTPLGAVIPNLISPNNDGSNDTWIIPAEYIIGTNTEITITNAVGETMLQTNNYNNDWPTSVIEFKSVNPVYYYVIKTQSGESIKGTITFIK